VPRTWWNPKEPYHSPLKSDRDTPILGPFGVSIWFIFWALGCILGPGGHILSMTHFHFRIAREGFWKFGVFRFLWGKMLESFPKLSPPKSSFPHFQRPLWWVLGVVWGVLTRHPNPNLNLSLRLWLWPDPDPSGRFEGSYLTRVQHPRLWEPYSGRMRGKHLIGEVTVCLSIRFPQLR
jgi:hypothetical protein